MSIDKERCRQLVASIDALFNSEFVNQVPIPQLAVNWVKEKILGEGIKEMRRLVDEMRPPVFYLLGRSGHGKSSLINALADQEIAEVGRLGYPMTAATKVYHIRFPGRHADWLVDPDRSHATYSRRTSMLEIVLVLASQVSSCVDANLAP